ncbi:MAG: aspartyl protease family protein [Parvularculales bacterium]
MIFSPRMFLALAFTLSVVLANGSANAQNTPRGISEESIATARAIVESRLIESIGKTLPRKESNDVTWVKISKSADGILYEGQLRWKNSEINNFNSPSALYKLKEKTISDTNKGFCNVTAIQLYSTLGGVMKVVYNTADAHQFASLTISCEESTATERDIIESIVIDDFGRSLPRKQNDDITWVKVSKSADGILYEGELSLTVNEFNNRHSPSALTKRKNVLIASTRKAFCNDKAVQLYSLLGGVFKVVYNTADAHQFAALTVACPELYFDRGYVEQQEYKEILKFDDTLGTIIIQVGINGVKGRFLLDTGAPNTITPDFAERVSAETDGLFATMGMDIGGNVIKGELTTLDTLHIGSLTYRDVNFVVTSLFEGGIVSHCLGLDGVIGANLMRKSVWKIDYVNRNILIADSPDDLGDLTGFDSIPFRTTTQGTPLIDLNIDGVIVKDINFDTGLSGHLSILKEYQGIFPDDPKNDFYVDGRATYGAGGKSQQTRTDFKVFNKVKIGTLSFDNLAVGFSEYHSLLGNRILENYDVILDWNSSKVLWKEVVQYQDKRNFDFASDVNTEGFFITGIYSNSSIPLLTGDQIVSWNGKDMRDMTESQKCDFLSSYVRGESSGDINLRVLRDSEEVPVTWVRD